MAWLSVVAVVLVAGVVLAKYRLALAGRPPIFPAVFFLFSRGLGVLGGLYNLFGSERYGSKEFCARLRAVDFASCRRFRVATRSPSSIACRPLRAATTRSGIAR
jgi:hypothetical protein